MGRVADWWRRPTTWLREHPLAADTILGLTYAAMATIVHLASDNVEGLPDARTPSVWTGALVIVTAMAIVPRRAAPVITLFAATGTQIVTELLEIEGTGWIGVLVAIYSVAAHTNGPMRIRAAVVASGAIALLLVAGLIDDEVTAPEAITSGAIFVAAFVVGDNMRRRREHVQSLADRAERAERERDLLARERVAEERNRIARELHDIVAHSVSVMVLQAGAARRQLDRDRDAAVGLLHNIEGTGRRTMDELRQVLGVLRDADGASAAPLPTLAELADLVHAEPDVAVSLEITGDVAAVPVSVGLSTYRVVQEALTNSRRHGGPGVSVAVRVACSPTCVEVMVDDDGRGASSASAPSVDGGGYGLIGMRERAAAAGGTLTAGPKTGGGWRVRARLPITATSMAGASDATAAAS